MKNFIARQIFTNNGPLAFLPLTKTCTSIVFSYYGSDSLKETYLKNIVRKYNFDLYIKKFSNFEKANLKFFSASKYYNELRASMTNRDLEYIMSQYANPIVAKKEINNE